MKQTMARGLTLLAESLHCILLLYALSNMAMLLRRSPVFILFFASETAVMGRYWRAVRRLTGSKVLPAVLLTVCVALQIAAVYFGGRVVGTIVPFHAPQ